MTIKMTTTQNAAAIAAGLSAAERAEAAVNLPPHQIDRLREYVDIGSMEEFSILSHIFVREGLFEHSNELTRKSDRNMLVPTDKAREFLASLPMPTASAAGERGGVT